MCTRDDTATPIPESLVVFEMAPKKLVLEALAPDDFAQTVCLRELAASLLSRPSANAGNDDEDVRMEDKKKGRRGW